MTIPASVMLQVEKAIFAALSATGCPAQTLDRGFTGEYSVEVMPAFNLALVEYANGYDDRSTDHDSLSVKATWGVFCYAAASGSVPVADVLDPMIVWAHQQLSDQTWSGLARATRLTGGKLNYNEKSGTNTAEAMITVEVTFDIVRTDPTSAYDL